MSGLIIKYRALLHQRPFITNVLTSTTFMTVGDLTSQWLLQNKDQIDLRQTLRFTTAGLIFVGPAVRGCLVMIDKLFGPTNSMRVLVKKLLFDQVICAPNFLAANISVMTLLKSQSLQDVRRELDESYLNLLKLNYTFWPFVQVINFYFIPLTYRVLFGSSAALIWSTLFSYGLYNKTGSNVDQAPP